MANHQQNASMVQLQAINKPKYGSIAQSVANSNICYMCERIAGASHYENNKTKTPQVVLIIFIGNPCNPWRVYLFDSHIELHFTDAGIDRESRMIPELSMRLFFQQALL
jgi:hypothetical protein